MCDRGPVPTDRTEYLNHLLDHIAEEGYTVQHIEGDASHPSYSHTVGLTAVRHPEIVVTGLDREWSSRLLRVVAHDIACHGARAEAGWIDFGTDFTLFFHPITRERRRLWTAVDIYGPRVTGLQAFMADDDGHFPWQPGYDAAMCPQPILGRLPRLHELERPHQSWPTWLDLPGTETG